TRFLAQLTQESEIIEPGASPSKWDDNDWIRIRLVSDLNGRPNLGSVLSTGYGKPDKQWSWEWFMPYPRIGNPVSGDHVGVVMPENYSLVAGTTYHLVVDANPNTTGFISTENYFIMVATRPRHPDNEWINMQGYNTNRAALFSDDGGATWQVSTETSSILYDREPVYILDLDTNADAVIDRWEGNPYYKSADEIYLSSYVGERTKIDNRGGNYPGTGITAGALELYTQQVGNPGELRVGVAAGGASFGQYVYETPLDSPGGFNWGWSRYTFGSTYKLWENETYDFYVGSPSSTITDYMSFNTMKTSWADKDGWVLTGFQGRDGMYIFSADEQSWETKDYRETPFRLVTGYRGADNFVSGVLDMEQVADWMYLEWDETRPVGTAIRFYVRTGNSPTLSSGWSGPYTFGRVDLSSFPNSRYIQYKIELTPNADRTAAPAVHDVRIGYMGGLGTVRMWTFTTQYP
ncbi:MAG: hypothetical protein AB1744_13845, partial [Candidatus Zixiibacteriota bacterium]